MDKLLHEIRDPIHTFIRLDDDERTVLDSEPVQRLRQIHQLAMSYLVYPGATHRRFEHCLGVMELAGRAFDVLTSPDHVHPKIRDLFGVDIVRDDRRLYWRRVVRMAALCHDLGHLPFSHAAEHQLLPEGWDHERLSKELIRSPLMEAIWRSMRPPLDSLDIAKLAVGQKKMPDQVFTDWEAILSEIIVGDALGVDRMDYLLRDSLHTGVAYGRFDHFRLIDTMRILPSVGYEEGNSIEPHLGVEIGGLHSAESMLLARYFMFTQVYFHPVRRIYDIHLQQFLSDWLPDGHFDTDITAHLRMTDTTVIDAMASAAREADSKGYEWARRIIQRDHFKRLWSRSPIDLSINSDAGVALYKACCDEFGEPFVLRDNVTQSGALIEFPVQQSDGRIISARAESEVLNSLPTASIDFIFVAPEIEGQANHWLASNRDRVLETAIPREEANGQN